MINVVLLEPEIPQNTGNIVRTCAVIGANLHLIKPLGFSVEDRYLKRAGLDYWRDANVRLYENIEDFYENNPGVQPFCYFASTKAKLHYTEVEYPKDCWIFFGKETKGLPEALIFENYQRAIRIPMRENQRSLNLSNSVAVVVYEILRQRGFVF